MASWGIRGMISKIDLWLSFIHTCNKYSTHIYTCLHKWKLHSHILNSLTQALPIFSGNTSKDLLTSYHFYPVCLKETGEERGHCVEDPSSLSKKFCLPLMCCKRIKQVLFRCIFTLSYFSNWKVQQCPHCIQFNLIWVSPGYIFVNAFTRVSSNSQPSFWESH